LFGIFLRPTGISLHGKRARRPLKADAAFFYCQVGVYGLAYANPERIFGGMNLDPFFSDRPSGKS
jgi:hypothetical protein